jgi:sigma-B regulation protein RsbU (phosphoserine phosphatase)
MNERQRVLIVDDTPENIMMLREALKEDVSISAATNGEKALALALKEPQPDLVLLDVMMPEIDGYEVCERLKADPATRDIPVIFVTALAETGDEARGLSLGAVDYITKPFNANLVRARVQNQLELKRHRDHLSDLVIERSRELLETTAAKERLEGELEAARSLQMAMLPPGRAAGEHGESEISAVLEPAKAVGGDLYDYFLLDDGRLCFLVGDVSDKGVTASLFMVKASTLMRAEASRCNIPEEILRRVNFELARDNDACMFVTLILGVLDLATGEGILASAGHEFPLTASPGKSTEFVMMSGGPAMGLDLSAEFTSQPFRLAPGDGMVFYTDGITEAFNLAGKAFGEVRLLDAVSGRSGDGVEEITTEVLDRLRAFTGAAPQSDDITLFALRYRGPRGTR